MVHLQRHHKIVIKPAKSPTPARKTKATDTDKNNNSVIHAVGRVGGGNTEPSSDRYYNGKITIYKYVFVSCPKCLNEIFFFTF